MCVCVCVEFRASSFHDNGVHSALCDRLTPAYNTTFFSCQEQCVES